MSCAGRLQQPAALHDEAALHGWACSTEAGPDAVVRAAIDRGPGGRSKGTGRVLFAGWKLAEAVVKVRVTLFAATDGL